MLNKMGTNTGLPMDFRLRIRTRGQDSKVVCRVRVRGNASSLYGSVSIYDTNTGGEVTSINALPLALTVNRQTNTLFISGPQSIQRYFLRLVLLCCQHELLTFSTVGIEGLVKYVRQTLSQGADPLAHIQVADRTVAVETVNGVLYFAMDAQICAERLDRSWTKCRAFSLPDGDVIKEIYIEPGHLPGADADAGRSTYRVSRQIYRAIKLICDTNGQSSSVCSECRIHRHEMAGGECGMEAIPGSKPLCIRYRDHLSKPLCNSNPNLYLNRDGYTKPVAITDVHTDLHSNSYTQ